MVPYYKLRAIKSCLSPEMQCNVCCTESSEHTVKLCTAVKSHPILVQLNFASFPNRMLADTIMKIHATTIIKDETINQNLLFFSPFSVVEHKCYFETLKVGFFLMKSLKSSQSYREHLIKHAWKPSLGIVLFRKHSVQ